MKRRAISVLLTVAMIFIMFPITSFADSYGDFVYTDNGDGTCTITDYSGSGGDIEIPASMNGLDVTIIGTAAFSENNITSVIIPESVERIEQSAFWSNLLSTVIIPNNVTYIGEGAFTTNNLVSVYIGAKVSEICNNAFISNDITSIIIPNSVTSIGQEAFLGNDLTTVTIGNGVTSIGAAAFNDNEIASVTGGGTSDGIIYARNGDGSIDDTTIVSYGGVSDIIDFIPSNVKIIGPRAFQGNELTSVIIPQGIEEVNEYAFFYNSLTTITIPNTVRELGESAFYSNDLVSVSLPNGMTSIGVGAFTENELSSVVVPNSVRYIGEYAFSQNSITSFTLPVCTPEEGYNFNEWKDGNNTSYSGDAEVSDHTTSYTAQFTPIEYTITYNTNGGTNDPGNPNTYTIEDEDIMLLSPTLEGNTFGGWYDGADFDTANLVTLISQGSMENIELWAKWEEIFAAPFTVGDGTEANPYAVSTPAQLNAVKSYPDSHFILINDIDLSAATSEGGEYYNDGAGWEPISVFEGVFDGDGFKIIGLNIGRLNAAFIDILEENAVLKNLGMVDGTINGMYAAGLVCNNFGLVVDSYNSSDISVNSPNSRGGGIVAINEGIISRCYNIGSVEGIHDSSAVGGIAGMNYYVVCDSYNAGLIKGVSDDSVGGIAGISYTALTEGTSLITNCYNVGEIEAPYPGGILGKLPRGLLTDSYFLDTAPRAFGWASYTGMILENTQRLSSEQMQLQETFDTFNFEYTWVMPTEGDYLYPILQTNVTIPTSGPSDDFAGGIGTDADPYQVSTPQQLNAVRDYQYSSFILVNDIDLYTVTSEGGEYYYGGKGWEPLGNVAYPFKGSFDSGGYSISGLNMSRYNPDSLGLFGVTDGATIRNINVEVNIQGECRWVGGIVGMAMNTTISKCQTGGEITITREWGVLGGIAGYSDGEIELCHNEAQVMEAGDNCKTGGIVGVNNSGTVQKSYNTGAVLGLNNAGVVSYNNGSIADCYNAAEINGSSLVYENIGSVERCYSSEQSVYFAKVLDGSFNNCYYVDSPINLQVELSGIIKKTILEMQQESTYEGFDFSDTWTFSGNPLYLYPELIGNNHDSEVEEPTVFAGGDGTVEDPYLVATPLQLNAIRNYENSHFLMTNDINMTEETSEGGVFYNDGEGWEPIYEFFGSFDGNGYSIIGLNIDLGTTSRGAFIHLLRPTGCLKNLTIDNSTIIADEAAAFAYWNGGLILDCVNSSTIEGDSAAGGIICTNGGRISKCSNMGDVYVYYGAVGGIASDNAGGIRDCYNAGSVIALDGHIVGGIVGYIDDVGLGGVVENCYNIGVVDGGRFNSGGIFGGADEDCSVLNCYYVDSALGVEAGNSDCYVFNNLRLSDSHMRLQETYSTFDFDYTWEMASDGDYAYPILQTGVEKPSVGPSDDYAGGIGSPEDPYQISTPSQLNAVRLNPLSSFVLTNDIDLTSSTSIGGDYYDEGKGWYPIGNNAYRFEGTFDGDGYEITGIQINRTEQLNLGLFGIVINAKIEDLGVDVIISGSANATGGIAGVAFDSEITGCYTDGIIEASYMDGLAGGISGRSIRTTIGQCYNKASLFTYYWHQKLGGITGENDSGDISECYNIGFIEDRGEYSIAAGIVAVNSGNVSDCYNASYVNDSGIVGSSSGLVVRCYNIGQAMGIAADPSGTIENCYYVEPSYPTQDAYDGIVVKTDAQMQSQSAFEQFEFGSVWTIGNNQNYLYPELINNMHANIFEGGDGSEQNPYQISTPEQLNAVRLYSGSSFIMINDIDMSTATREGGAYWNDGAGWKPIGDENWPLSVSFNGNGFAIIGLYINRLEPGEFNSWNGLFKSLAEDSHISNLGMVDCEIYGAGMVGAIAGQNYGLIQRCYNTGFVKTVLENVGYAGGIVGDNSGVISECYNSGLITKEYGYAGGIAGRSGWNTDHSVIIENCYNAGTVYASGIAGAIYNGSIINCYNVGNVVSTAAISRQASLDLNIQNCYFIDAKEYGAFGIENVDAHKQTYQEMQLEGTFSGFDFDNVWILNTDSDYAFPELRQVEHKYQNGTKTHFTSGTGVKGDPFIIMTAEHLNNTREFPGSYFVMNASVDLSEAITLGGAYYNDGLGWEPICEQDMFFFGSFDGNGKTISNQMSNRPEEDFIGLFGYINGGNIVNLTLSETNILGNEYVGGLSGFLHGNINNCVVDGIINGNLYVGGVIGQLEGAISNCSTYGEIHGGYIVGGLTGESIQATIDTCSNYAEIFADGDCGGIVGRVNELHISGGIIQNCTNDGDILCTGGGTGGIAASVNDSQVEYCINNASVTGVNGVGGLLGYNYRVTLKNSFNSGRISGDEYVGGLIGSFLVGSISDCYNVGTIVGEIYVGGLVGKFSNEDSHMTNCYQASFVNDKLYNAPVVGWLQSFGTIENLYRLSEFSIEGYCTLEEMSRQSTFAGFDFTNIWEIMEGERFPVLQGLSFEYTSAVLLDNSSISLKAGESKTLAATITPDSANNKSIEWTSSDESIATVTNGVVTGVNDGVITITAATVDGGFTDICEVTVIVPVDGVSLDKETSRLSVGETETLTATVSPADATNKNVTWESNNESVATVADGVVTAVAQGTATITVTTEDGGFTDTCVVTVTKPVTGVSLDKETSSLSVGETETLTATISPTDATNQNVTWASDNEGIALVDSNGNVSAVASGTATITVRTEEGGFTDTCDVTVTQPVTGVSLEWSELTVYAETESMPLISTVYPTNASNKNLIWSSSNNRVATVVGGLVNPLSSGTATITVTTEDGGFTDTCVVTVKERKIQSTVYAIKNDYLTGVAINTSVEQLKANLLNESWNIKIFDANESEYTGGTVATGMKVKLFIEGDIADELTVIILGDVNSDGIINITDYTQVRLDILALKPLADEYLLASDVNEDGLTNITDYTLIRLDILNLKSIH